jgi:class 3 adenylate cyclase
LQKELKDVLDTVNISKKIHNSALAKIASDNNFHKLLGGGQSHQDTFVVSVDIRRSTELMLKAKNSEQFANFITQLCNSLVEIFKNNFAIVDKFTGDGILAFFPAFFTESDAGYYACRAASEAIDKFRELYANNRDSFKSILTDVGLGVGIDFGEVYFADLVGSLTVIGEPVVYACRFGSAPAGKIFVNQPAYAKLRAERYLDCFRFEETEVEIKHQGKHLCYSLVVDSRCSSFNAASPSWYSASIVDPIKISS